MRRGLPSSSLEAPEAAPLGGAVFVLRLVARPLRPLRGVCGSGIASGVWYEVVRIA